MSLQRKARFLTLASYLPEQILGNDHFEKTVDTTDEWIWTRTGIRERRIAAKNETASMMGAKAAQRALNKAKMSACEIDLLIVATMTPDFQAPSTAVLIQEVLGAKKAAAFDVSATCGGYLYLLSIAKAYLESGRYNNVLIVAAEKMSSVLDYSDRTTCVLFGDGASAAILVAEGSGLEINWVDIYSDGNLSYLSKIPAGGSALPTSEQTVKDRQHYFQMRGKELFRHAARDVALSCKRSLNHYQIDSSSIHHVVAHQANVRILDSFSRYLGVEKEKFYNVLHKYGNTSSSSVGIAFDELLEEERVACGENVLLVAFGIGLTWGSALVTRKS